MTSKNYPAYVEVEALRAEDLIEMLPYWLSATVLLLWGHRREGEARIQELRGALNNLSGLDYRAPQKLHDMFVEDKLYAGEIRIKAKMILGSEVFMHEDSPLHDLLTYILWASEGQGENMSDHRAWLEGVSGKIMLDIRRLRGENV